MGLIKRMLGLEAPAAKAAAQPGADGPLGLDIGRMPSFSPSLAALLDGHSYVVVPGDEKICARGSIELGQRSRLLRYYLDDEDYFLQVVMGGAGNEAIDEVQLFGYFSALSVTSKPELKRLTATIGLPTLEHEGETFERQWGSETGLAELIPLLESVTSPESRYTVKHHAMLYAREIGLVNRKEYLLFSVEEDEQGNVTLTTAVGVTLQLPDLQVL